MEVGPRSSLVLLAVLGVGCEAPPQGTTATRRDALDVMVWEQRVTSVAPPASQAGAMAYDSARGRTVMFGGAGDDGGGTADTWEWDGTAWRVVADAGPSARSDHGMAYDSARHRTVLYGGYQLDNVTVLSDTWEWDGIAWQQVADAGPPIRYLHDLSYDSLRGKTVMFGSLGDGDTWEWDGVTWVLAASTPELVGRCLESLSFDEHHGRTVMFGGGQGFPRQDTLEWDGVTWVTVADAGPPPRQTHASAYDPVRLRTVMFGGCDPINYYGDTWEWDGVQWTQSAATGPSPRRIRSAAFDTLRGRFIVFGGFNGVTLGDTWEYYCQSCLPSSDGGTDAGIDAGTDAGVDGGSDAGVDGGTDAGVDGGTDAGLDGGPGVDGGQPRSLPLTARCACSMGETGPAVLLLLFAMRVVQRQRKTRRRPRA